MKKNIVFTSKSFIILILDLEIFGPNFFFMFTIVRLSEF